MCAPGAKGARRRRSKLIGVSTGCSRICFIEPNPVPIKYALSLKGVMSAEVRLPLCEMSDVK